MSSLFSPEALIILPLAALLDVIGIICFIADIFFGVGEILSFIPDAIGLIFLGTWAMFRSQTKKSAKESVTQRRKEMKAIGKTALKSTEKAAAKAAEEAAKAAVKAAEEGGKTAAKTAAKAATKARRLKFLAAALGELIPIIGVLPFWTWYAYSELKSDE